MTPDEAHAEQRRLAPQVELTDRLGPIRHVAGADAIYRDGVTQASVAVLTFPSLELVDEATVQMPTSFPYVPGLLSFREAPALLNALGQLNEKPDVVLCDSQGWAHPRRFGLACHVGVEADIPTIGVAKNRLCGEYTQPGSARGSWSPLLDEGDTIGAVLRTRDDVKPLFVSIGHRVSLPTAIAIVLGCAPQYRLPETTRQADRLSRAF